MKLSDDSALEAITQEILSTGDLNGKIIVDTTTVHPTTTKKIASAISNAGGHFLAGKHASLCPLDQADHDCFIS